MTEANCITLPFHYCVPEKLSGTNPASGERVGCTGLNASTDDLYYNADRTFWNRLTVYASDTYTPPTKLWGRTFTEVTFKTADSYAKEVMKIDFFRYEYCCSGRLFI